MGLGLWLSGGLKGRETERGKGHSAYIDGLWV